MKMIASATGQDDHQWKLPANRQNMVTKIDEAILQCGAPTSKNAIEMESQVFQKAKTKEEYLSFVARLILHIKEIAKNKLGGAATVNMAPGQQQQIIGNNNGGMQMMGGGGGGGMSGGNVNIPLGNMQQQQQMQQQQMQQQQQQQQLNFSSNQMQGGQVSQGTMNVQLQHQLQQPSPQQQSQQQNNMFQQQQQMQAQQGQHPTQQQHVNQQQMQQNMQGMMPSPGQQQMMMTRGMQPMQGGQQMRMMAQPPNMANQLTRMAQQRNVDGVMMSGYGGGQGMGRGSLVSPQFMSPNMSQNLGMGSPGSHPPQGSQGPYGNSPGSAGMIHSPAPPSQNVLQGVRPYMVPSPGSSLNTPMMVAPTPSPRNAEEQACMEKIKELRKYTDLLQKMLAKAVGNDDAEKSSESKMKKLLDILTNPRSNVSMDILVKCEAALKKMERTDLGGGGPASVPPQPTPGKDQTSPFVQFFETVSLINKSTSAGHTWKRTVQPALDAFSGNSIFNDDRAEEYSEEEDEEDMRISRLKRVPAIIKKELRYIDETKFKLVYFPDTHRMICEIIDKDMPTVPKLILQLEKNYPRTSPKLIGFDTDYSTTPFLRSVASRLKESLLEYPNQRYSASAIFLEWDECIQELIDPTFMKVQIGKR